MFHTHLAKSEAQPHPQLLPFLNLVSVTIILNPQAWGIGLILSSCPQDTSKLGVVVYVCTL